MRFLVYLTSWIRNLQYDIESTFKLCEDVTPGIEDFVERSLRATTGSPPKTGEDTNSKEALGSKSPNASLELAPYRGSSTSASSTASFFIPYDKLVSLWETSHNKEHKRSCTGLYVKLPEG